MWFVRGSRINCQSVRYFTSWATFIDPVSSPHCLGILKLWLQPIDPLMLLACLLPGSSGKAKAHRPDTTTPRTFVAPGHIIARQGGVVLSTRCHETLLDELITKRTLSPKISRKDHWFSLTSAGWFERRRSDVLSIGKNRFTLLPGSSDLPHSPSDVGRC